MIPCVRFSEVDAFLQERGYRPVGETDVHILYERGKDVLTIHKPNVNGDVTEIEGQRACHSAGLDPPDFETHWCD